MGLLSILTSWKDKALLAALGAALVFGLAQTVRLKSQANDLADERKATAVAQANFELHRAALDRILAEGDRLKTQAAAAEAEIAKVRKTTKVRIERIYAEPTPTTCEGAVDMLRRSARGEFQ